MGSGTGYIRKWTVQDVGGIIHVCAGDNFVGDDVAFPLSGCSDELKEILESQSIKKGVACPAPTGAVHVTFDFDFFESLPLAVNVDLN